jgi:hypothetical protein
MTPREIEKMVEKYPTITLDRLELGTHYKVFLSTPCGKQLLVVGRTSSDYRADMNNEARLRRWARGEK